MDTDRIEKTVILNAPRERVWRAISNADEFGIWFGVAFGGKIVPTKVDADVAKMQEPYTGKPFEFVVERIEPMHRISFRWHPFAIEPGVDYSHEPMTLIVFELEDADGGTRLTITESGFDRLPIERRAKAFAANDGGWEHQARLVGKYLALHANV
jgi:uncharacterized protein YndB with AHSA1/START domain